MCQGYLNDPDKTAEASLPGGLTTLGDVGYLDDEGYTGGFTQEDIADLLETMEVDFLGWSAAMAPAIMGNADLAERQLPRDHEAGDNVAEILRASRRASRSDRLIA